MVRKRLVTVLTINDGVLFRTRNFEPDYRYTLNFIDAWSIDEIVLLDITRPGMGDRDNFYKIVSEIAENCFVPLTVGGGVRSLEDYQILLRMGADKISINSIAVRQPDIIYESAQRYGSQCTTVSIDAKKSTDGVYRVYTDNGKVLSEWDVVSWAKEVESRGAGEILIQSIDKDGMLEGYDNELNRLVSDAVNVPVLVCGGAGNWAHFVNGFNNGGASAVCTTNIYHFTEQSIHSAKTYLFKHGIPVRT